MNFKKPIFAALLLLGYGSNINAQSSDKYLRLEADLSSISEGCYKTNEKFYGKIVSVNFVNGSASISNIILETNDKKRTKFELGDFESLLSNAERGWIPTVFKNGNHVALYIYRCGNGGYPYVYAAIFDKQKLHRNGQDGNDEGIRPSMPVEVGFRKALMGPGYVLVITSTDSSNFPAILTITDQNLGTSKNFRIDIQGYKKIELGHLEGCTIYPGNIVTLENKIHQTQRVRLSDKSH